MTPEQDKIIETLYDTFCNWYHDDGSYDEFLKSEAFKAIQSFASSLNVSEAGRWVRASERLPGWYKEAKWRHPSAEIVCELMWTSVAMELCSHLIENLEWLDETPSPSPSTGIREALEEIVKHIEESGHARIDKHELLTIARKALAE